MSDAAHVAREHGETPLGELVGTRTWPKFGCSTAISTIAASIAPGSSSRPAHKPSSGGPGSREVPIYRNWNVIQNSLIYQCGLVPATLRCDRLAVERKNR